ncbi:metal ABC transporter substrate-binding protein [Granulosicoccus antarcticus]|uniref:Manganese-binding lipoprotein MntA n=1 Tax=Granulosicoccus antarcticus IMCC3135 TaxID=1192854 RepID=A0A2Z2NWH0_9GAMM|nr:zinc ABC transporter substrate-binding protein [Granulosicoccus antarcticus]ASJ74401.1 Manganese-binding lipoprotein MntA [Granulosicoccus antarcticus IMCC3135]
MNSRIQILAMCALFFSASPFAQASLNILACEPEWQALAEELGGERVKVESATHAMQDPHHVEARPSLIIKARDADMVFCTGAELEIGWLPLLLEKSGNRRVQVGQPGHFLAALQVERIEVPQKVDRSQGDVHADGNPHVYLDPRRLLVIAEAFSARLQAVDAEHAEYYRQRLSIFSSAWTEAVQRWEKRAEPLRGKRAVVYHKNWSYLLDWLQIETVGDLEPKPGIPPTSGHLAELLQTTRAQNANFVLIANYQNKRGARWLADNSDIALLELPFTIGGNDEADDLQSLYDSILTLLLTGG